MTSHDDVLPVRRALISVADKADVVQLGESLAAVGVEMVSSGTTASVLREAAVPVTAVADVTGFPEMLEGRVKTLHPRIHAGILADKRKPTHLEQLAGQGIEPFDLVVVNLYPFLETVVQGASPPEVIEQIDIGGPTLVRAAAKNFESVGVVVHPELYAVVVEEMREHGGLTRATRLHLARQAFEHVTAYDAAIAAWFAEQEQTGEIEAALEAEPAPVGEVAAEPEGLPEQVSLELVTLGELRYGENPHQRAAVYVPAGGQSPLGGAEVLQGKEMSFNNWLDAEAARAVAGLFDRPVAVIVKHHNPCGVALGETLGEAYARALECDRVSAFGGIVAFNGEVDEDAAHSMADVFTEVVIAPVFSEGALAAFGQKPNLRVVRAELPRSAGLDIRMIDGGALVQDLDAPVEARDEMKVVTSREPTEREWEDLLFAWKVAARVKSNAIVLASGEATVGVGAGQMNRLTSVAIAAANAGERARGSCLASDAFFPFRDGLDRAGEAGVAAVIQPGGSLRDEEVLAAAEDHGMAMVLTGRRHFRH